MRAIDPVSGMLRRRQPAYDPGYASKADPRRYSLPMGKHGFLVPCANCGKTFNSKGLRSCWPAASRLAHDAEITLIPPSTKPVLVRSAAAERM